MIAPPDPDDDLEPNPEFPEILYSDIYDNTWKLCTAYQVKRTETIDILEARGKVSSIRHQLRSLNNFRKRNLFLGDNLGAELTSVKGRASGSFPVLICCRRMFCLGLSSGSASPSASGPPAALQSALLPRRLLAATSTQV